MGPNEAYAVRSVRRFSTRVKKADEEGNIIINGCSAMSWLFLVFSEI
jgi:hypothetical protein